MENGQKTAEELIKEKEQELNKMGKSTQDSLNRLYESMDEIKVPSVNYNEQNEKEEQELYQSTINEYQKFIKNSPIEKDKINYWISKMTNTMDAKELYIIKEVILKYESEVFYKKVLEENKKIDNNSSSTHISSNIPGIELLSQLTTDSTIESPSKEERKESTPKEKISALKRIRTFLKGKKEQKKSTEKKDELENMMNDSPKNQVTDEDLEKLIR